MTQPTMKLLPVLAGLVLSLTGARADEALKKRGSDVEVCFVLDTTGSMSGMNETAIVYGSRAARAVGSSKLDSVKNASAESNAWRLSCQTSHFSGKVFTGGEDLVDLWKAGKVTKGNLSTGKLPKAMRGLKLDDLEKKIVANIKERKKIQAVLNIEVKKRTEFLLKQKSNEKNADKKESLDGAIDAMLSRQLKN